MADHQPRPAPEAPASSNTPRGAAGPTGEARTSTGSITTDTASSSPRLSPIQGMVVGHRARRGGRADRRHRAGVIAHRHEPAH